MASVAWKTKLGGTFRGSLLFPVADRLVALIWDGSVPTLKAWSQEGKKAWALEFERNAADLAFPYGDDLFVDGPEALRVSVASGEVLCRRDFGAPVHVRPADGAWPVFLVGSRSAPLGLVGVTPDSLETVWEIQEDARLYVVHQAEACAYRDDLGELWTMELPSMRRRAVRRPFRSHGEVSWHGHAAGLWCHFFEQFRYGVNMASGEKVWEHFEPEPGYHGYMMDVAGERLLCGNRGLSCYDGGTGEALWRQPFDGGLLCSRFHVIDDVIWAGTQQGGLYLLSREDGTVLAEHRLDEEPLAIAPLPDRRLAIATYKQLSCVQF